MTRKEFSDNVTGIVRLYLDNTFDFDSNPQLRIAPGTYDIDIVNGSEMLADIEDDNETVEDAAAAEGASDQDGTEFQARRNPDFVAVNSLINRNPGGRPQLDPEAIEQLVNSYYPD